MKTSGWIVEWREEGFRYNGREVYYHETRASAEREMKKEHKAIDHIPGQVLSLYRVTIDPEPVRVIRSSAPLDEEEI
jgi:hypothetical protein